MARTRHFLRAWRQKRGLKQARIAERLNVSQTIVSRLEGGKRHLTEPMIYELEWLLDTGPGGLFRSPDDQVWMICERISKMTPEQQATALRLIDAVRGPEKHGDNTNDTAR